VTHVGALHELLAPVQCGHGAGRQITKDREVKLVNVKVQHVELRCAIFRTLSSITM
jgi:hypothetical protein